MKLGLINSAWAQTGRETSFGIRKTKEIGFDSIDIFTDPLDIDIKERKLIKDECDRADLPIISVACVAVGLVDFNPSVQRFHIDRVRAYLDLAYLFEAQNVLLVLGEYIWQREVIPPADQWGIGVENVRTLGHYAEDLGLEIALELEPFHLSLLNDVESMARFLDDVNCPAVRANLDISHLVLAKQPAERLERLRGRVAHVHISDCDGRVHGDLPPGRGVVDFPPYLQSIKELGLDDAAVSIELEYAPDPDGIEEWVREAYEATARLMRNAGLRLVKSILARSALALILALLLGWPVLAIVLAARDSNSGLTRGGLIASLGPEREAARVPRPLRLAATTVAVVLGTEAIALPLGVPLAFLLFRTDLCGRRVGVALSVLLAFVPLPLVATAWLGALGNAGRTQALGLGPILTGRGGAAFIQAMAAMPWIVLLAGVGLRSVEPELEEAALVDLPAWRVLVQVTLRQSAGALAGAALAVAVITAGDMTVTDLLQIRTYAEEAYVQYQLGHGPEAAAVTLLPLLLLGTLVAILTRGLLGADRARLASAVARSKVWRLGRWRVPLGLVAAVLAGPIVVLPLYSLIWWAGRVGGGAMLGQGPRWSIGGFAGTLRAALADAAGPLMYSLTWSALAASATVVLAWALAWVSRSPGVWRGVVAASVALTLATPGPVVGMALKIAYIQIPLMDSPLLIVLAHAVRTLPFALLVLWPGLRTIPPAWLDAAEVDGHGEWGQIGRVAVPATRAAFLAAWGVTFVIALGELPATNLVAPPGTMPLTVLIWTLLHSGVESQIAGVALIMLAAIATAGMLAAWALARLARVGSLPID